MNMKYHKPFYLSVLMFMLIAHAWAAESPIQEISPQPQSITQEVPPLAPYPDTWIDWKKHHIYVIGKSKMTQQHSAQTARLTAIRSAQADAYRKLTTLIYGLHLDEKNTIDSYGKTHRVQIKRVEGVIKGAKQVQEPVYLDDSTVEIKMMLSLPDVEKALGLKQPIAEQ